MATEKDINEKKPGEGEDGGPPVAEVILAKTAVDPDQAVIAEQAIRHFVTERLSDWYAEMEGAIDSLEAWIQTQGDAGKALFTQRGFFDFIGDSYIGSLLDTAGGKGTPIMDAIATETNNTVSWAQHSEGDLGQFINYMRRGLRDACWYVRDALPSVVSHEWPQLLDLATSGSTDFIPALFTFGLPTLSFKATDFSATLIASADAYRKTIEPVKEQVQDQQEVAQSSEKKAEVQQDADKIAQDDSFKKQQMAQTQSAMTV